MPTINISFDLTDDQVSKVQTWWARVSAGMADPPATVTDYFRDEIVHMVREAVQDEERKDTIEDRWNALTDDQRARIKAIASE